MKQIPLTRGKIALVDDIDYEYLSGFKWFYNGRYAVRQNTIDNGGQRIVFMHRVIMKTPKGMETDHIDGNGLNNCRNNLRICTKSENMHNTGLRHTNTSGYKGVSAAFGKWKSQIRVNGKKIYLGLFSTPEEAYKAHNDYAKDNYGEFIRENESRKI